jgi:RHS repeat-associated protein
VARLIDTSLKNSGNSTLDSSAYLYDPANERTNLTRADSSTVAYRYDPIGQVKVANGSDDAEDRGYTYDSAGNLNYRTNNGTTGTFLVNPLNELTNALSTTLIYDQNGNLTNSGGRIYSYDDENRLISWSQGDPASGALGTTFAYDGLGRLRTRSEFVGDGSEYVLQGVVNYIYDGNRVIQERDGSNNPITAYTRGNDLSGSLEGAGGIGGLLARSEGYHCPDNFLTVTVTNTYEFNLDLSFYDATETLVDTMSVGASSTVQVTIPVVGGTQYTLHVWEPTFDAVDFYNVFTPTLDHHFFQTDKGDYDTSDGGDLLCVSTGSWSRNDYYFADGNGNVTVLVDASQNLSAVYRYDPFGNIVSQDGAMAGVNVYRFSSKEIHEPSGMYYYLYRFYDPGLQRWVNRDPVWEFGFELSRQESDSPIEQRSVNVFAYAENNPISRFDPLGLCCKPDYLGCLAHCIEQNDPLNLLAKGLLTGLGGPIPKSLVSAFGGRVIAGARASRFTTAPSIYSMGARLGGRSFARIAGRAAFWAYIAYGDYMFLVETRCASYCAGDPCAYP